MYEKENWYIINGLSFNFFSFICGRLLKKGGKERKAQILHRKVIKKKKLK